MHSMKLRSGNWMTRTSTLQAHRWTEVARYLAQADVSVSPDAGLLIQLALGKTFEKLAVQSGTAQLRSQKHRSLRKRGGGGRRQ